MVRRLVGTWVTLICFCAQTGASEDARGEPRAQDPFFQLREHQAEYAGPGREEPAPVDVDEILLGYFGPGDPSHPDGGDLWSAAQLAVDEANRQGGYRGRPFRLTCAWSDNPWGTGVSRLVRLVYADGVWAIVGGIDGASTHLAEQVVAKARLALVSPVSTDKTVNLANVPWVFSCLPGDHLQAPVLAEEAARRIGNGSFVLVSAGDHDSRMFLAELGKCLGRRRMVPRRGFECQPGTGAVDELITRVVQSRPSAVVLIASAHDSARLVASLRQQGFAGLVFGGPWMGRRRFLQEAGAAAEGVVFPLLFHARRHGELSRLVVQNAPPAPRQRQLEGLGAVAGLSNSRRGWGSRPNPPHDNPEDAPGEFVRTFTSRVGSPPDYAAAHTYDAVRLLVAAVRKAGLNRARICDALRELSPWSGVAGTIRWDATGSNARPVRLGTIRDGRVVPVARLRRPASSDAAQADPAVDPGERPARNPG